MPLQMAVSALNQQLSEDRADNVANFLVQQGHIPLTNLLAPGAMGESRQIGDDKTAEGAGAKSASGSEDPAEQGDRRTPKFTLNRADGWNDFAPLRGVTCPISKNAKIGLAKSNSRQGHL